MDIRQRWQRPTPSGWRAFSPLTLLRVSTQAGLLLVDIVLWVVFGLAAEGFLSSFNVFTLSRDIALFTAIGLAQMVVLSMGEMNLAVGAIGGGCGDLRRVAHAGVGGPRTTGGSPGHFARREHGMV